MVGFFWKIETEDILESCFELSEALIPKWILLNSKKCNLSSPTTLWPFQWPRMKTSDKFQRHSSKVAFKLTAKSVRSHILIFGIFENRIAGSQYGSQYQVLIWGLGHRSQSRSRSRRTSTFFPEPEPPNSFTRSRTRSRSRPKMSRLRIPADKGRCRRQAGRHVGRSTGPTIPEWPWHAPRPTPATVFLPSLPYPPPGELRWASGAVARCPTHRSLNL